MAEQQSVEVLEQKPKRFRVLAILVTVLFAINLAVMPWVAPFRINVFMSAGQMAIKKEWNWGLSAMVNRAYGEVQLTHLGTLETDGIYIPPELAVANNLKIDGSQQPIELNKAEAAKVRTYPGVVTLVSKTRCLKNVEKNYCPVLILANPDVHPTPFKFIGVKIDDEVFALVEAVFLTKVTGVDY